MTTPLARARHLSVAVAVSMLTALFSVLVTAGPSGAADPPVLIPSDRETAPVFHSGDAMDDPAIWVHPTDPAQSLLMGNDKGGGFETYDLEGNLVQRLAIGTQFWGNVDVRQGVQVNGITHDLVGVVQKGVRFYTVDPSTRQLSAITEGSEPIGVNGEGFCLYQSPTTQKVYGISITIGGTVNQFELTDPDADGLLSSTTVRTFSVGSEAEGCVADDDTGALYISEENEALWRYDAEPSGGTTRTAVDVLTSAGGHLTYDIEGVTLVDQPDGKGFIIVSAQNAVNPNASFFNVYRREGTNAFVKSFRVGNGTASDDCDRTDGVTATTAALGPAFPRGMFVCQDNNNDAPGVGHQDLKMVQLENIVNLDGGEEEPPPPPPPPPSSISFVGQATRNANSTAFTVNVPAAVQSGDQLLLFASAGSTSTLTGPGAGWTQVGRQVDGSTATTVWRRTAAAGDAGTSVRVATGSTFTKVGLTLAAYRGVDPTSPLVSINGAAEPGSTASHTTPLVPNGATGARRVSYWSDKSGATTQWSAPSSETVRATTFGSGGGRIGTLLSDLPTPLTAGTPASTGGLTAAANSSTSTATTWTILLRQSGDTTPPANQPPTAVIKRTCSNLTCTFDATDSTDPDDGIARWAWDFGDGETSDESVVEHTYDAADTYTVTLTVTDDSDATDDAQQTFAVGSTPPPPPPPISFVGQATRNANSTAFTVQVPSSVQSGDALLLFASQGGTATLTGPGAGWTQVGRVVDGETTTVWRKVAVAGDAGSTVRVASGTTYMKVALTLAAYRGTDTTNPVLSITGAAEPSSATSHTSPSVANGTSGAWRVSYWSDKNSDTTTWTSPSGESTRASTFGSGGGRVSSLLTDSNAALTAGSPANTGALVARANASSSTATMWTVLLRPRS
jgi:myo-inositol-hexaphosphate 3-phosphohydrolase/PKD repeat protein